jgi:hypothetical protein
MTWLSSWYLHPRKQRGSSLFIYHFCYLQVINTIADRFSLTGRSDIALAVISSLPLVAGFR